MIRLPELTADDRSRLFEWRNRPEVAVYMYTDHLITEEEHAACFASIAADDHRRHWVITADGEAVGAVKLADIDRPNHRCSLGIYVAEPEIAAPGCGSAALFTALGFAFDSIGIDKVCCEALAPNERAISLYKRLGFQREGCFRRHVWKGGQPIDVVALALLRDDWERTRDELRRDLSARGLVEAVLP